MSFTKVSVAGIGTTGTITLTNVSVAGVITATDATFSGNVSVGGTLTYEDVTNVDSVGLVTARSGILVTGGGGINLSGGAGVVTATAYRVGTATTLDASGLSVSAGVVTATTYRVGTATTLDASGLSVSAGVVTTTTLRIGGGSAAAPSITPTGDTDTGIFFPSADTIAIAEGGAEAARIDSSGRLLLGTSTSQGKWNNSSGDDHLLQVESTNSAFSQSWISHSTSSTAGVQLDIGRSRGTSNGSTTLVNDGDLLGHLCFQGADGSEFVRAALIQAHVDGTPGSNDMPGRLTFSTTADGASSPTERARIDSSGRLLVGTSSYSGNARAVFQGHSLGASQPGLIWIRRDETLSGAASGADLGIISFGDSSGGEFAQIIAEADGGVGSSDYPGRLVFSTTADGQGSPTERMRLDSSGNLQINSTDSSAFAKLVVKGVGAASNSIAYFNAENVTAASSGLYAFMSNTSAHPTGSVTYAVNGQVSAASGRPMGGVLGIEQNNQYGILGYYSGSQAWGGYFNGSVYATGTYQGSDARLKNVIEEIEPVGVLNKLDSIRSIRYTWKENSTQYITGQTKTEIGFLAQEVQEHFPEVVTEVNCSVCITEQEKDSLNYELGATYGVDYAKMVPVLLSALKEAKGRIEALEAKVAALESA